MDERVAHLEKMFLEQQKEIRDLDHENRQIRTLLNMEINIREAMFSEAALDDGRLAYNVEFKP